MLPQMMRGMERRVDDAQVVHTAQAEGPVKYLLGSWAAPILQVPIG
jgi:hypothetical protein